MLATSLKRTSEDNGDGDTKRPRAAGVDVSWLWDLLFGPEGATWGSLKRVGDDQATVLAIVKGAGLRASVVANPRAGVSVYTHSDSADEVSDRPPMEQAVWLMLGIHPSQDAFNAEFMRWRPRYLLLRLVRRLLGADSLRAHPAALHALAELEALALDPAAGPGDDGSAASTAAWEACGLGRLAPQMASALGTVGGAALAKDAAFVGFRNDSLFNALLDRFLDATKAHIHDVTCNAPQDAKFRRLNMVGVDRWCDPPCHFASIAATTRARAQEKMTVHHHRSVPADAT